MSPAARLKWLNQRKQELLVSSEIHRCLLEVECSQIQQRLEWVDRVVTGARQLKPFVELGAPIIGAWLERRHKTGSSWLGVMASAMPLAGRIASLVRQFLSR
jgi:hypothetical protein